MAVKKSSYVKTFGLFLLMVAGEGAVVVVINRCLRAYGMDSSISLVILWSVLIIAYYMPWKWLSRRLNAIEKR